MSSSTGFSRFSLGTQNNSASSSSTQHQQTNPFLLHQQRHYYQQQNPYYNHLDPPPSTDDDGSNFLEADAPLLQPTSSSASPINYFFSRATSALDSPLIGDMARYFSGEENGTDDDTYFILNNGHNIEGVSAFDSNYPVATTTVSPEEHVLSNATTFVMDSLWNVFEEQYLRHNWGWTVTLVVAYMLILVIGIVGNIMVILVVALRPQMRTVTNMFIMNLAVADLFVIVFCVPATLLANVFTPWILGSFMCKAVAYVQGVSVCASAYSLAAISLDRCKAIYRPMERPRGLSKSQALSTICLIWVVALLMTIPWAVIFNVITSDKDGLCYCVETWENEQHGKIYFLVANLIFCYCLPLFLISLSNVVIWCHVSHRKVPQDAASATTIKKMHRRTRHGVRKMLGIVTLAFLLSWLPLYILVTRVKFSKNISEEEANLLDILMPLAQWLGSWNSSINPVLYAFLNSKFREMFKSLLPSWMPCIPKNNGRPLTRNNVGRGTLTNGTFTVGATTATQSYTTVFTARSSTGRSSNNSRRSRQSRRGHQPPQPRRTFVSSFRGDLPQTAAVPVVATTALVGGNGGVGGGNGTSTVMTTTMATVVVATTATITDL